MVKENEILGLGRVFKNIRLVILAKRLNLPAEYLISILKEAGYTLARHKSQILVTSRQLEIISQAYSKSLKQYFNDTKKSNQLLPQRKKTILLTLFRLFVPKADNYNEETIDSFELDDSLLESFFYGLVETIHHPIPKNFSKHYLRLKIPILKSYRELHKKTISIFIKYFFGSFSIDEDSMRSKSICFS
jgi:hypothetical protein